MHSTFNATQGAPRVSQQRASVSTRFNFCKLCGAEYCNKCKQLSDTRLQSCDFLSPTSPLCATSQSRTCVRSTRGMHRRHCYAAPYQHVTVETLQALPSGEQPQIGDSHRALTKLVTLSLNTHTRVVDKSRLAQHYRTSTSWGVVGDK